MKFCIGLIWFLAPFLLQAQTLFEQTPVAERVEGQVYPTRDGRPIYWPKAFVSPEDVYEDRIHKTPMDRRADVAPVWEGFARDRLRPVPEAGVHPRILITPGDVEQIRAQVAAGEDAPRMFRLAWDLFKQGAKIDPDTGHPEKLADKMESGPSWMESWTFTNQCLFALITDDADLAKQLIPELLAAVDMGIVYYEAEREQLHPAAFQNFWVATQSTIETEIPQPRLRHSWNMQFAQEYDYLHPFMSEAERSKVRDYIALIVRDRISHGFELPANKHIINHEIMAWKWMLLPMAIEGEPGFEEGEYSPADVLAFGTAKFSEVLEWYISPGGVMYENVKGHMPKSVLVALARRDGGQTLAHPHLVSAAKYSAFTARYLRSVDIAWTRPPIRNRGALEKEFWDPTNRDTHFWTLNAGMFGSSFDPWVMSYLYPGRKDFDFVYKSYNTAKNYDFWDLDYNSWIRDLEDPAIRLWTAHDGLTDDTDTVINYNQQEVDFTDRLSISDPERGVAELMASWDKDALRTRIEARSDAYTGGHETPEFGNFTVSADGIGWAPYQGPYQPVIARNVITIDGFSGKYPPVPARFVDLVDTPDASSLVMDYAEALQFTQPGKTWLIDSPSLKTQFHAWMRPFTGWDFDRDMQFAFMPHLRWLNENKASTDFSHWDGQNPWPQYFKRVLSPVTRAWRTINLIRGEHPYLFVIDDVQMDDELHEYRWNFNLQRSMTLVRQPDPNTFVIGRGDIDWQRTGSGPGAYANGGLNWKRTPKKGEPLLMVKVLQVNSDTELPPPAWEYSETWPRIVVPALTRAPDYRVLVYPFREGDPEPVALWSEDRSRLTLKIGDQVDQFDFQAADGGRTVFALTRENRNMMTVQAQPPRPQFAGMPPVHRGTRYDRSGAELGPPPQLPDAEPTLTEVFIGTTELRFQGIAGGQDVYYTLDGSDPDQNATRYTGPVEITDSCQVKALTRAREWKFGDAESPIVAARFVKQSPVTAFQSAGAEPLSQGVLCRVYEIYTASWDENGFFNPTLNLLPDLSAYEPILATAVDAFELPAVVPQREPHEQFKGFYRFTGEIDVPQTGVYTLRVASMAPVRLLVGDQSVIEENGAYHQDQRPRYGQIALEAGRHAVDLVVADHAFWRLQQLGPMPFSVAWSSDDGENFTSIPRAALSAKADVLAAHRTNPFAPVAEDLELHKAVNAQVEPGLVLKTFDRTALAEFSDWKRSEKSAPEGMIDVKDATPVAVVPVRDMITGSDFDGELKVYEGFYRAPFDGVYEFKLDGSGNNALMIGGELVVANNLPGLRATSRARLEQGLHPLRILFGRSGGGLQIKTPANMDFFPVAFADLARPADAEFATGSANWLVLENPLPGVALVKTALQPRRIQIDPSVKAVKDEIKGTVLELDGTGGIVLENVPMVHDAWTLSFWVQRADDADMKFLQPAEEGVSAGWWRGQVNAGPPRRAGTGVALQKEIPVGEWFHVTITADDTVTIYINGELRTRQWYDPNDGTHTNLLFRRSDAYTLFKDFKGRIADLKFWNAVVAPE